MPKVRSRYIIRERRHKETLKVGRLVRKRGQSAISGAEICIANSCFFNYDYRPHSYIVRRSEVRVHGISQ